MALRTRRFRYLITEEPGRDGNAFSATYLVDAETGEAIAVRWEHQVARWLRDAHYSDRRWVNYREVDFAPWGHRSPFPSHATPMFVSEEFSAQVEVRETA